MKNITTGAQFDVSIFLPKKEQAYFEVTEIRKGNKEWIVECRERETMIPKALKGKNYKQDGFKEKVEVVTFPFQGEPLYLHYYRRRWKNLETGSILTNQYELHPKGMKATPEFGDFLKELPRSTRDKYRRSFPNLRIDWNQAK